MDAMCMFCYYSSRCIMIMATTTRVAHVAHQQTVYIELGPAIIRLGHSHEFDPCFPLFGSIAHF